MEKIKVTLLVGLVVLLMAMFIACDPEAGDGGPSKNTGTLKIYLSDAVSRSIDWEPTILMEIDSYEISGSKVGGDEVFGPLSPAESGSTIIPNLREGAWEVTVVGKNADGTVIGENKDKEVTILAGKTVEKEVVVEVLPDDGYLWVSSVSWPADMVADPHILIEIWESLNDEEPLKTLGLQPDLQTGAEVTTPIEEKLVLAAGYYHIKIKVYNKTGSGEYDYEEVEVATGSVRIVSGETTEGIYAFDQESFGYWGGLDVTITHTMPVPFSVSLSRSSANIWGDDEAIISVEGAQAGDIYYWFIDGEWQENEVAANELTVSNLYPFGYHSIGVTVKRGEVLASANTKVVFFENNPSSWTLSMQDPVPGGENMPDSILVDSFPHFRYLQSQENLESFAEGQLVSRRFSYTSESETITSLFPVALYTAEDSLFFDSVSGTIRGGSNTMYFGVEVAGDNLRIGDNIPIRDFISLFVYEGYGTYYIKDLEDATLSISQVGNVGGLYSGHLVCQNVEFVDEDGGPSLYYHIELIFSFLVEDELIWP